MMIDTHAHYDDKRFSDDRDDILKSLNENGISNIINVGCDLKRSQMCILLAEKHDFVYATVGFHPHSAEEYSEQADQMLREMAKHEKVLAIGEIGLDYYYDNSPRDIQKEVMRKQIKLANDVNLPVVIHDRDAHKDCLDIINENPPKKLVYHCYSGSVEYAQILVKMGYMMSFGGTTTFKNAKTVQDVIKAIPLENIMLETDCPYLTPEPHRGKRNESKYLHYIAEKIAELRKITKQEVIDQTTKNAKEFFGI